MTHNGVDYFTTWDGDELWLLVSREHDPCIGASDSGESWPSDEDVSRWAECEMVCIDGPRNGVALYVPVGDCDG